ncbi:MAG: tRNA (adenosine(37)-N6)-threonylcarbamoyltransferase complex dimerization subunit type 1 TsaB [Caldisericaceae bacterium]
MNVLIFNQAISPSILVFGGEKEVVFAVIETPPKNSPNNLIYLAKHMFDTLNIAKDSVEAVATVYGPGSFTGTRVGVVDAKVIAYALRVPLFAINSLDFVASHYEGKALTAIPAGRKEYFGALFDKGVRLSEDAIYTEDELKDYSGMIVSQDERLCNLLPSGNCTRVDLLPSKLLKLTLEQIEMKNNIKDPLALTPKYLHAVDVIFKKRDSKNNQSNENLVEGKRSSSFKRT